MRQHALMAIAQVTEPDSAAYYTDGSVDPDSGRTGAAAITTDRAGGHPTGSGAHPPPTGAHCDAAHRLQSGATGSPAAASQRQCGPHHHHSGYPPEHRSAGAAGEAQLDP
ncbi:hypothetical protein Pcinc_001089 [Petrolisthes cinctipes]|uniref:Uncharacterized protein n=1 Tax=Petrolisthes cinctipes TaxID=88211 RepID=A0AAE1GM41_PETCI|nr:hypothetical protein Pcinc_001089 [Petrolisthes cinctipes]